MAAALAVGSASADAGVEEDEHKASQVVTGGGASESAAVALQGAVLQGNEVDLGDGSAFVVMVPSNEVADPGRSAASVEIDDASWAGVRGDAGVTGMVPMAALASAEPSAADAELVETEQNTATGDRHANKRRKKAAKQAAEAAVLQGSEVDLDDESALVVKVPSNEAGDVEMDDIYLAMETLDSASESASHAAGEASNLGTSAVAEAIALEAAIEPPAADAEMWAAAGPSATPSVPSGKWGLKRAAKKAAAAAEAAAAESAAAGAVPEVPRKIRRVIKEQAMHLSRAHERLLELQAQSDRARRYCSSAQSRLAEAEAAAADRRGKQ